MLTPQAVTKQSLHHCSVQLADMDWQEEESAQVTLEMGGMSIERRLNHKTLVAPRCKPAESGTESANTDSMFAWLSKLLPGL